jgi:hypothetical protein
VELATKLLAGSVAFSLFTILQTWSRIGFALVASRRVAWWRPGVLVLWALTIALTWKGSSWAGTMLLIGLAWDVMNTLTGVAALFAFASAGWLPWLQWVKLGAAFYAAWLLLEPDSTDWFRARS